jgi:mercuric ion transport protein
MVGVVVAAACCIAPILLVATGVIGAGALAAAIYGLFPVLIIAVVVAGFLLWRHRSRTNTRKRSRRTLCPLVARHL